MLTNPVPHREEERGLLDELANVRLRETTPGVIRMDHDSDRHDDQAIALALCVLELLSPPTGSRVETIDYRPGVGKPVYRTGDLVMVGEQYFDRERDE